MALALVTLLADWKGIPRSIFPIYWGTAFFFIGGSRYVARLYYSRHQRNSDKTNVVIYGAGQSGIQLANALVNNPDFRPVAYLDDDKSLQKAIIQSLPIYSPANLTLVIEKLRVEKVFLALPAVSKQRKSEILRYLEAFPVQVLSIPGISELISGEKNIDELREIEIDELLGRDSVAADEELMNVCIHGLAVMVTGAGGSIGSELCRQIIRLQPSRLVLFDASEFALYQIEQELRALVQSEQLTDRSDFIVPALGSVQDQDRLSEVLFHYRIKTLYHAAAYKHVPMVEHNPIEGIMNNTFGTLRTALAAQRAEVRHFVLISTDKAVRPTNIMGGSKRMAELALQGIAQQSAKTLFSMVRFGNVLGSSGSVVPLFRQQIRSGGPITLTHPDITRYFMTIPEAAQLVIQAGAMAKGGEVFLLDMGEPIKIIDLARRMIHLSGMSIKDETHPDGDIAILTTGLRPGEKLYEELLIDSSADKTRHPKIFHAHEDYIDWDELTGVLDQLETACAERDTATIQDILETCVQGFKGRVKTDILSPHLMKADPPSGNNITLFPKPQY
ncbi:unnamed protein product [Cyprideis torosa]|uniref:Uncharacterized protein n=1 Tax=Cyprideis torosa TaxID=163714 RepID=A0A7R8ZQI6_9CRUS|nr:unnamed protein product [Cyprideis torosa]CAG0903007.1 unnamed protein product [Cyprideis torosa]